MSDLNHYQATLEIIEAHCRANGRTAQLRDAELLIGVPHRVAIRVMATDGKPQVSARATGADAISDVRGLLEQLVINIPERQAALDDIHRAVANAAITPAIVRPVEQRSSDHAELFDCMPCDIEWCDFELPSCDAPCDVGCDL